MLFQAIVPQQIIGGTGVGDAGANAYASAIGIKPEEFVARFGAPMPPRDFGDKIVSVLDDPQYAEAFAIGLKGDTGITILTSLRERRLERRPILAAPCGVDCAHRRAAAGASSLLRASKSAFAAVPLRVWRVLRFVRNDPLPVRYWAFADAN